MAVPGAFIHYKIHLEVFYSLQNPPRSTFEALLSKNKGPGRLLLEQGSLAMAREGGFEAGAAKLREGSMVWTREDGERDFQLFVSPSSSGMGESSAGGARGAGI